VIVHNNPFREAVKKLKNIRKKDIEKKDTRITDAKEKDRWIEDIKGFEPVKKLKTETEKEE